MTLWSLSLPIKFLYSKASYIIFDYALTHLKKQTICDYIQDICKKTKKLTIFYKKYFKVKWSKCLGKNNESWI